MPKDAEQRQRLQPITGKATTQRLRPVISHTDAIHIIPQTNLYDKFLEVMNTVSTLVPPVCCAPLTLTAPPPHSNDQMESQQFYLDNVEVVHSEAIQITLSEHLPVRQQLEAWMSSVSSP